MKQLLLFGGLLGLYLWYRASIPSASTAGVPAPGSAAQGAGPGGADAAPANAAATWAPVFTRDIFGRGTNVVANNPYPGLFRDPADLSPFGTFARTDLFTSPVFPETSPISAIFRGSSTDDPRKSPRQLVMRK